MPKIHRTFDCNTSTYEPEKPLKRVESCPFLKRDRRGLRSSRNYRRKPEEEKQSISYEADRRIRYIGGQNQQSVVLEDSPANVNASMQIVENFNQIDVPDANPLTRPKRRRIALNARYSITNPDNRPEIPLNLNSIRP